MEMYFYTMLTFVMNVNFMKLKKKNEKEKMKKNVVLNLDKTTYRIRPK